MLHLLKPRSSDPANSCKCCFKRSRASLKDIIFPVIRIKTKTQKCFYAGIKDRTCNREGSELTLTFSPRLVTVHLTAALLCEGVTNSPLERNIPCCTRVGRAVPFPSKLNLLLESVAGRWFPELSSHSTGTAQRKLNFLINCFFVIFWGQKITEAAFT